MMRKRFLLMLAGAAVAAMLSSSVQAGIVVVSDAGGGSADVLGTSTGATVNTTAYTSDAINSINGSHISPTLPLSLTLTLTGSGTSITGGSGVKDIGNTVIDFTITGGIAFGSHLNVDGTITSVSNPKGNPGYDFSLMPGGLISISLDHTGANFANVVGHNHTKVKSAGLGVEESAGAIPEPASMVLLGMGATGLLGLRRLLSRTRVTV
jgi:hypothetical protein